MLGMDVPQEQYVYTSSVLMMTHNALKSNYTSSNPKNFEVHFKLATVAAI